MKNLRDEIKLMLATDSADLWQDIRSLGDALEVAHGGSDADYAATVLETAAPVAVVELKGCRCLMDLRSMAVANDNVLLTVGAA